MKLSYNKTTDRVSWLATHRRCVRATEEQTMTEAEWFASKDAAQLVRLCPVQVSPRKLRLFMANWCRLHWDTIAIPAVQDAVELAEKFADGKASKKQLEQMYDTLRREEGRSWAGVDSLVLIWPGNDQMTEAAIRFAQMLRAGFYAPWGNEEIQAWYRAKKVMLADLVRDIVGNPFRPVAFDPKWRTTTAVQLARGMYESRDFSAMPILADALQDAGCDSDDILNHCRDANQLHVRGCWVVDLLLGKG
jgi:hypothetical protein